MEWERVAAVVGIGGPGSGYVIGPRLVLSSAHVVGAVGASVTVFRPGRVGEFTGRVVWCGTPGGRDDAALVQIDDSRWTPVLGAPVVWGRSVTHRSGIACVCWGAPDLVQREGRHVEVSQQQGTLNAGDRMVGDRYVMNLTAHPPDGSSPWGGLSGAALFCEGLLTGVIAVDPAGRRHAALEAVPAYVLSHSPEFAETVAAHTEGSGMRCEPIELRNLVDAHSRVQTHSALGSPAGLLSARRALVPFRGRDEMLTELHDWTEVSGTLQLVHGPGGQGKTRLAHEFAEQLVGRGWVVVWLDPSRNAGHLEVLADTVSPLLVVIDYAETRTLQLVALLETLTRRRHSSPAKVLLLARTAGGWWDLLAASNDVVRDVVDTATIQALPVLDETAAARGETYQAAVDAFVAALNRVPGLQDLPWSMAASVLSAQSPRMDDQRRTVLAVQMNALADLFDCAYGSLSSDATGGGGGARGPEDRVLDHERGYWQIIAQAHHLGLAPATLTDVVAATVLLGPTTPEEVGGVLSRVPAMADQPFDRREAVRGWLLHLYPAGEQGEFEGLQPDRLAERLVGRLALEHGRANVVDALAPSLTKMEATRLLTVCTRAAAHAAFGESVGHAVTRWCTRHASALLKPAIQVATQVESPGPLVRALEQFACDTKTETDDLRMLLLALPQHSQVLAETAVILSQELVARRRAAAVQDSISDQAKLASSLMAFSARLGAVGRWEEGLAAITEAVEIVRRLVSERKAAFLPDLAMSLNNLSVRLGALGRSEEGLAACAEAVDVYRRLVGQQPEVFLPDLAMSLTNSANLLGKVGKLDDGLAANIEAVELYRRLAEERPDRFLAHLGGCLNNLSVRQGALRRWDDALASITESVEVHRRLVDERPDAFLPHLAGSLNNLSSRLGVAEKLDEALAASIEAVEIWRRLAGRRPEVFLPDLAMGLANQSLRLGAMGLKEKGQTVIAESIEIRRQLAKQRPAVYSDDLKRSLRIQAWLQDDQDPYLDM